MHQLGFELLEFLEVGRLDIFFAGFSAAGVSLSVCSTGSPD
jgi:hypothetical protein